MLCKWCRQPFTPSRPDTRFCCESHRKERHVAYRAFINAMEEDMGEVVREWWMARQRAGDGEARG